MTNVSVFLAESAEVYPDAVALRCGAASATYSELASDAARLADCLIDGGVRPGDRVAIMLPNGPAFVVVLYGIWYAGGVAVPMSPSQRASRGGIRAYDLGFEGVVVRIPTCGCDHGRSRDRRHAAHRVSASTGFRG